MSWLRTATVTFSYNDVNVTNAYRFTSIATQKIDSITSLSVEKYYDGLGRLVQTQTTGVENGTAGAVLEDNACSSDTNTTEDHCDQIVDYEYDTAGRLWKQSVVYAKAAATGYQSPDAGQAKTTTTYDMLGRVQTVTATDSSPTSYVYTVDTASQTIGVAVTDARNNTTTTFSI